MFRDNLIYVINYDPLLHHSIFKIIRLIGLFLKKKLQDLVWLSRFFSCQNFVVVKNKNIKHGTIVNKLIPYGHIMHGTEIVA